MEEILLKPFGCSMSNWEECYRRALSKYAARQQVLSEQIATHKRDAMERAVRGPTEYNNIAIFQSHHPALVPLAPRFAPRQEWYVDMAIPDIAVVGLAKAGTTQMWRLLTSHPNATSFGEDDQGEVVKEYCLPYEWGETFGFEGGWEKEPIDVHRNQPTPQQLRAQHALWTFFATNFFHGKRQPKTGLLTVNACYHNWDVEITRHYLLPFASNRNQKYIVLFRDPADLIWSAFNFWKIPGWDHGDEGWAEEGEHYRSPELFHELLLAGNKTSWWRVEVEDSMRMNTVTNPRKLVEMFGANNVLFLRNEDMLPSVVANKGGVLDRLSEFTGLERSGFPRSAYSSVANCNDKAMETCGESRSSAYHKSGGREMLPESRTLIYLHFLEECKIWAREFGIEYPDCLNILKYT